MPSCVRPRFIAIAALAAPCAWLAPALARAQTTGTTTTTGPSVTQNPNALYPTRIVNGVNLGESTRPIGLNPDGINYADCVSDMTLRYSIEISGFSGQSLEVWVGPSGVDCSTDTARGSGGVAQCWYVGNAGALTQISQTAINVDVRAQDIVGPQQAPPYPPTLVHEGSSACLAQPTASAVNLVVWFVPITGTMAASGATAYSSPIMTDLVGPPAPSGLGIADGDTLFVVGWTANTDSDTAGYDVFIDPIPGRADGATASGASPTLICPDSGASDGSSSSGASADSAASSAVGLDASTDADLDADVDASDATVDAGSAASSSTAGGGLCYYAATAPPTGSITCNSSVLQSAMTVDSGAGAVTTTTVTTTTTSSTSASSDSSGSTSSSATSGTAPVGIVGIATIPCDYLVGASCTAGQPAYTGTGLSVNGEGNARITIKGLTNGVTYNVAVAAVDSSGNVGPPSSEACDFPAPVADFWTLYRDAGGQAGGGFCAIRGGKDLDASSGEPIGTALALGSVGAAAIAIGRRRRRK